MRERHVQREKSQQQTDRGKAFFLASNALFRNLNATEIQELERITTSMSYPSGRVFYRPGEPGGSLFLLQSGRIQLYHLSPDGRKLVIAILEEGDCFGETALIDQGKQNCFAEALTRVHLCIINKHDIESLLAQKPVITLALLKIVGQRLTSLESQLLDTAFKGTSARLATLLLRLAHAQEGHAAPMSVNGLSHEALAERLGVYRETVSTALREFKDAGIIELGRKHITITSPALLEEIAAQNGKNGYL